MRSVPINMPNNHLILCINEKTKIIYLYGQIHVLSAQLSHSHNHPALKEMPRIPEKMVREKSNPPAVVDHVRSLCDLFHILLCQSRIQIGGDSFQIHFRRFGGGGFQKRTELMCVVVKKSEFLIQILMEMLEVLITEKPAETGNRCL